MVDISAILRQALTVMDQVIRAVQFVFLFALVAGVLVLYAALLATQDERTHEAAVMRALGASRAQVAAAQRAEFLAMGLVAGLLAAAGATAIGFVLSRKRVPVRLPHESVGLGRRAARRARVRRLNAWLGARRALSHPPILALREA